MAGAGPLCCGMWGVFEGGIASAEVEVVAESGTGDLDGLRGTGSFSVGHEGEFAMILDYEVG